MVETKLFERNGMVVGGPRSSGDSKLTLDGKDNALAGGSGRIGCAGAVIGEARREAFCDRELTLMREWAAEHQLLKIDGCGTGKRDEETP
jgi:hypothetical protein